MKFERIVLLVLLGVIVVGGFIADKKISSLENALANQQVDTVLVNIPLTQLDTVIVAHSDTVYAEADTIHTDSGTIIEHYPTATIKDTSQPLFTGTYTYVSRADQWTLKYEYKSLGILLEFPDKFDFRKVKVSTIPDLGGNITITLSDKYQPYKPPKGIGLWVGAGYAVTKDADAVFLTGGLTWKKTYVGITRSETGWGITAMRAIFAW
jgi:hypothetical protein